MRTATGLMSIATPALQSAPNISGMNIFRQLDGVKQLQCLQSLVKREIICTFLTVSRRPHGTWELHHQVVMTLLLKFFFEFCDVLSAKLVNSFEGALGRKREGMVQCHMGRNEVYRENLLIFLAHVHDATDN